MLSRDLVQAQLVATVQVFNSFTSRPDVCYCLVVQTPKDNMSKIKPRTSIVHVVCESKLRSVLRSSMHPYRENVWQSGVRSCYMPGLSEHFVQELDVGTVWHLTGTTHYQQSVPCAVRMLI